MKLLSLALIALCSSPLAAQDSLGRIADTLEREASDRRFDRIDQYAPQEYAVPMHIQMQIAQRMNAANAMVAQADSQVKQLRNANLVMANKIKALEKELARKPKGKDADKDKDSKDQLWELAYIAMDKLKRPAEAEAALNDWLEVVCKPLGIKAKASISR